MRQALVSLQRLFFCPFIVTAKKGFVSLKQVEQQGSLSWEPGVTVFWERSPLESGSIDHIIDEGAYSLELLSHLDYLTHYLPTGTLCVLR